MKKKPIIGITLDYSEEKSYSDFPWYALRLNYSASVEKYGAVPLMLPYCMDGIEKYIEMLDGLILTGGDFDIHPKFYGEEIISEKVSTKDQRTLFEIEMCKRAIAGKIPLLGICAGHQLINVIQGGSLIQHIPDEVENCLNHEQPKPKNIPYHEVEVKENTKLNSILGNKKFKVNSTHHQAVKDLGRDLIISAVAPDGVIEAIEHKSHPFCMGIEWHPEYLSCPEDEKIMEAFVKACEKND